MKTGIVVLSAFALVAVAATAGAQGNGGPPGGRGRGGPGGRCAATADSLTDTQKQQVRALAQSFAQTHAAQLDSLRAIMDAARAAREAGKSQDEIRAIMESGKPINDALAPDRKATSIEIAKLLTPAQVAAGCMPPLPGGGGGPGGGPGGPGGRRGGPPPGPPPAG